MINTNEQTQYLKAELGYGVEYYKGRGIASIVVNSNNTLSIRYTDGTIEITNPMFINGDIGWPQLAGKPFNVIGSNLVVNENGVLSVDTTDNVEEDNTKPITSGGVSVVVGNIDALLAVI